MSDDGHLADMRVEYGSAEQDGTADLDLDALAGGWLVLLRRWLAEAEAAGVAEPNAMVLATVAADGRPAGRTVLCKAVDATGLTFYTNYGSAKGAALAMHPHASATFPWYALGRQVHVRGPVIRVEPEVTAAYWARRPRGSQLGAWASQQSRPIGSRADLRAALRAAEDRFPGDTEIPVPPHWGGYRLAAETVEFWQGRASRLHNRLRVQVRPGAPDLVERLQP